MIDRSSLTSALAKFVSSLEDDLRVRSDAVVEVGDLVRGEWEAASSAGRTDHSLEVWREGLFTQVAVGWVLATVFVRFCEDNGLISVPLVSGPGGRRRVVEDGQSVFYRSHPAEAERGFLLSVFETAANLPGLSEVLGSHSPVWLFGPSNDACGDLLALWRQVDPETGELVWDFTDPAWDTRFLGDLYQDLSESARKQFALLQTPDFVEQFILDRTLDPALDEFGLEGFRMIDPACGSGHFLLGSFDRLFARWEERAPEVGARALAAKALGSVFGVDLNPFAVAIARFRLLAAALKAAGISTLSEAPVFHLNVAAGDSLLHGPPPGQQTIRLVEEEDPATRHLFATEDGQLVNEILSQKYHAVVANPPYITPKDPAARGLYRTRYTTASGKYALTVPFMERLFDLAVRGGPNTQTGFVGQITGNSFMKREFGKNLIERFLASEVDLTHVIDTSGAYIPGHGTPTVILLGRNRRPVGETVRAVLGIRGEPATPTSPARGQVWTSIARLTDEPGSENEFITVSDLSRSQLRHHPWSLEGGGANDLMALLNSTSQKLDDLVTDIGPASFPGLDEAFVMDSGRLSRFAPNDLVRPFVAGDALRDWIAEPHLDALVPYGDDFQPKDIEELGLARTLLWPLRRVLSAVKSFGGRSRHDLGEPWWTWYRWIENRYRITLSLTFAFVATHNHFALERGGKVFNRSVPVVKLPEGSTESEHLELLGPLNASLACFWMKQVFHNKGSTVDSVGARQTTVAFENFFEFDASKLRRFPLPELSALVWAECLDRLAVSASGAAPRRVDFGTGDGELLRQASVVLDGLRRSMVSVQEELDWRCYFLYGLTTEDLSLVPEDAPPIEKGERAFEIALARKVVAGEVESSWFERHGSTPITELPGHWSDDYKKLVERRLELIESDRFINLVERPEYKRRWNWADWGDLEHDALQGWLLDRLEAESLWTDGRVKSVAELADRMRADSEFVQVAELYVKSPEVDLTKLMGELVEKEAVPFLGAWRYTKSGLRKRADWEKTWDLQRREDAGEDVGNIPVPPKYAKADFRSGASWSLRGKLDVPKERFVSYPGLNRETDPTLLVGWAGWDHLEQATALASLYEQRRTQDGWDAEQLTPILAGIGELVPWVVHWHNDPDPATGQRLGDFFDDFATTECQTLGIPRTALASWAPPAKTRRTTRSRS